jgi:hypothetical protein
MDKVTGEKFEQYCRATVSPIGVRNKKNRRQGSVAGGIGEEPKKTFMQLR